MYLMKLILLIFWIKYGMSEDEEVFLLRDRYCITNGSSAIVFNKEIRSTSDHEIQSYFFHPSKWDTSHFGCDIDAVCPFYDSWTKNTGWNTVSSMEGPVNEYVTDRRWEALPLIKTDSVDMTRLLYDRVSFPIKNSSSFVIPFSIRGKLDGHMFLCEGTRNPSYSNCYWIMLAAYGGKKSAIRKCPENHIPSKNNVYPVSPCRDLMDSKIYASALNENSWRHFKIDKDRSTLKVLRNNEDFLKFHDDESNFFNPETIWLHSKNGDVLWKMHQYKYLYTDTKGVSQLGPNIVAKIHTLCISMFVALCHTCSLKLRIKTKGKEVVLEETINSTRGMWKEVRVTRDISQFGGQDLLFYLIRVNSLNDDGFWALDDVRLCSENEYRYIKSEESSIPCQRIEIGKDVILTPNKNNVIESHGISCPENSIGQHCVPCQLFDDNHSGYCSNFKYCEIIHGREICHCSSGYEKDCATHCSNGTYGHGCQKNCSSYCANAGCSCVNGFCAGGCKYDSFKGNMCEIPPEAYIDASPIVSDIKFSEAKLRMDSFEVVGSDDKNLSFIFQYIEDEENGSQQSKNSQRKWMDISNKISVGDMGVITIDNLEADTFYRVRAVIIGNTTENIWKSHENKEYIKSTRWKTQCHELSFDEIRIEPANISTKVTVERRNDTCKLRKYHYSIGGEFMLVKDTFDIAPLDPDKEYNLIIRNTYNGKNITSTFRTTEGVPSGVRNFSYTSSPSKLHISWIEPVHKNGNIKYKIVCKFLQKIPCGMIGHSEELSGVSDLTSITFNDLRPYSTYIIIIQAFTTAGLGEPLEHLANTSSNGNLTEKEKISITSPIPTHNRVKIWLSKMNCDDLEGPIYMRFQVSCINKWCTSKKIDKPVMYDVKNAYGSIDGLLPFSNYTVGLEISRDSKDWIETGSREFQTKPSVPNEVTELQAYSKNSKSISLRWKAPFPPTGILEKYKIFYYTESKWNSYDYNIDVPSTKCDLWPDYHCAKINNNIWDTFIYNIQIQAKNEIPLHEYGKLSTSLDVVIKDEPPQPPYGVKSSWQENNDLNLSWFHPNVTNGQLISFEVILTSDGNRQPIRKHFSLSKYTLIYHFTMESKIFMACTNYDVTIYSHKKKLSSTYISHKIISPPSIPLYIPKENIHYNSTTTGITIRLEYGDIAVGNYNKTIYIVVSKSDETEDLLTSTENLRKANLLNLNKSRIVSASIGTNRTEVFTIGQQSKNVSDEANPPLEPGTNYSINLFLVNECYGVVRLTEMQKYMITMGDPKLYDPDNDTRETGSDEDVENGGLWALILLAVIPIVLIGYWYRTHGTSIIEKAVGTRQDLNVEELPLTDNTTDFPPKRVKAVKPKKTLPMQVLPPLQTKYSKKVRLVDFVNYVKTAVESGELESQHDLFPRGLLEEHERGSLIQNKTKNRYKNLIAYDHTRVKLKEIPGEEFSDYINANYIDGYRKTRVYIATQGPKNSTLADFWRMIWQENVKNIFMLANVIENGKKKVEQYWPDINETTSFGDIKVKFVSAKVLANFDLRTFEVFYRRETRQVEQLHFTTWPDHGVPLYPQSLVPFLQRMLKIPYNPSSPILVHCSAGVGRTGTIILCDICLRMAASENSMDFLAYLENLRKQRSNMVDNLEQYKLAHLVVLECLFGMRTAIPCSKNMEQLVEKVLENDGVAQQMRYLEETWWQDSAMETMLERNDEVIWDCPEKNRFQEIVPERYRVFLSCYPTNDPTSSYINAVLVDDFRNPGRYIVTQQPMPNTLGDFWRLLIERDCSVIINLNKINNKDKTVCKFWPTKEMLMSPLDYLVIRHVDTKRLECYEITTVMVEIENTKEKLSVDIVSINNWKPGNLLPPSTEEFLTFREAADTISRNSKNVLVTCYDGATASGLYLAMSFLIEKMKLEQECDVCLAVRSIRHSRKQFVRTEEQYEYLFRTSLSFINGFQNYANFD